MRLRFRRGQGSTLADDLFEQRGPTFSLDPDLIAKNVRNARRGAVGGPSGMTARHLRMLLESEAECWAQDCQDHGPTVGSCC